ncbi:type II restriction endonuclease [Rothia sp. P6271]|uniref:type II restriction endonuclease n=1 Tax=Rothia sp. P6271 TaxID=3402659 RepID=UPI003ACEC2A7
MELELYKIFVKTQRKKYFKEDMPYDLVYRNFEKLGLINQPVEYFLKNASSVIEKLRSNSWDEFQKKEQEFTSKMLSSLYSRDDIKGMDASEAISWFVDKFPMHIYSLNLSNTQSRRSRAGKEFEAIIELILIGADIPMDSQGNIGKKFFEDKDLGKMVDIVSPGSSEYSIYKRDTVLISAKTTLRERWQEVPEEMGRTGAREMFLVTLDESISQEVIETLDEANIQVVTTRSVKETNYNTNNNVITFERLLDILKETASKWDDYNYPQDVIRQNKINLEKQLKSHHNHSFVEEYYNRRIEKFSI